VLEISSQPPQVPDTLPSLSPPSCMLCSWTQPLPPSPSVVVVDPFSFFPALWTARPLFLYFLLSTVWTPKDYFSLVPRSFSPFHPPPPLFSHSLEQCPFLLVQVQLAVPSLPPFSRCLTSRGLSIRHPPETLPSLSFCSRS